MKKGLAVLLAFALVLGTMSGMAFAKETVDVWDGTVDTSWYNATDTEFTITTAEQWAGLAYLVNGAKSYSPADDVSSPADFGYYTDGHKSARPDETATAKSISFEDVTIKLAADLDFCPVDNDGNLIKLPGKEQLSMMPVGYSKYTPFKGTLDGQGHTIKNLFQGGWDLYGLDYKNVTLGLFGNVVDATIKDLVIDNFSFNCEMNLGGIAAVSSGKTTFENITVKNSVIATGGGWWVGGIVGWAYGNQTFKGINIDETNILAQVGGHYDTAVGGIVGGSNNVDDETIAFEDCYVACKLDVYNDCTANYNTNSYRNCGMIIGGIGEDNEIVIDGVKYPDIAAKGISFKNVNVVFGNWSKYTYCWSYSLPMNCQRIEPGVGYKGVDVSKIADATIDETRPFDAIIGAENAGDLNSVRGKVDVKVMAFLEEKLTGNQKVDFSGISVTDTVVEAVSEAMIGNFYYATIEDAIAAAKDGDTIKILAGTYDAFTVPANKNNLIFVGETGAEGRSRAVKNLVTIRTNENGIETATTGIYVQAEKATFKNLNLVSGSFIPLGTSGKEVWMASAIGSVNGSVGAGTSNLKNLTIENCNFKGDGAEYAVWTRACDVTIIDSTIDGYTYGVESYALGADQEINLNGIEMSNVGNAIHTVSATAGSAVTVEDSVISAQQLHSSGAGTMVIENSVLNNVDVMTYGTLSLEISKSALYDSSVGTYTDTSSITLSEVYVNNVNEIVVAAKADNITFETYYPTYEEFETNTGLENVPAISDIIMIEFAPCSDAEGELVYDINLVASSNEIINRLNSVDLTFAFTQGAWGKNDFEIIASNSEVAINPVENSKYRYEFHYNGKDNATTDTGNKITIGEVKFTGYGEFSFAVDSSAATNAAHTTKLANNIVDTFVPDGDTTVITNGELVIDNATTGNVTITVPTRKLTVNVAFPNAVEDNAAAYQAMKVEITGVFDGVNKTETYDLGGNMAADGAYVVTEDDLVLNNAYTVTVSGAGYRTARYTVTMTEPKTLNFWNNVMDEDKVVEVGKDSSTTKVTFLAGDIVKDNNINIYDLSAVVSYFASASTIENGYAKYDLNRDGVIDSKDVAYVLVSWNN